MPCLLEKIQDMDKLKEQFVPFIIAQLFDQLQFNYHCQAFYNPDGELIFCNPIRNSELINDAISAPTFQQATDYLRTKHKIHVAASPFPVYKDKYGYQFSRDCFAGGWNTWNKDKTEQTYYGSFATALKEAIAFYLIKEK